MQKRTLLLFVMISFITVLHAQKKNKITGYAITAAEKGGRNWKEVRMIDISTGEELKTIYKSSDEMEALNARTGKPVAKKQLSEKPIASRRVVNLDMELDRASAPVVKEVAVQGAKVNSPTLKEVIIEKQPGQAPIVKEVPITGNKSSAPTLEEVRVQNRINNTVTKTLVMVRSMRSETKMDQPFSTNSAAMAYDKKHERLYYTPMGINQLRYIDLKSNNPKLYYFEDEPFGLVSGTHDVNNQITRMVIASDGDGYALSNDANHLIRFTTGKKPTITDLGELTDDAANGKFSVHSRSGYGGDMIADASENLYLITANRNVFRIDISSKVATYKGTINGLPRGFSTNGAMVEEGSKIIVASAESTEGYYRFDLNNLEAEKVSAESAVFNASDLANGKLVTLKKKKDKKEAEQPKEEIKEESIVAAAKTKPEGAEANNKISVYPNPVTSRQVKLSFADQPAGTYKVQFLDLTGRVLKTTEVNISGKVQVVEFRIPSVAKGSYFVKITNEPNQISVVNKLNVQ